MISHEIYKMLHVVSIVLFFSFYAASAFRKDVRKVDMIVSGIALFVIFVSGMGLIARLGMPHGEAWPTWIRVKLGIWILIGASGHMILKRFTKFASKYFFVLIGLLMLASYMANTRFQ